MEIIPFIKEILILRQSLLIPGLGIFTVRRIPARRSDSATFLPPCSRIDFQEERQKEDLFLKNYLLRRTSLSETEADREIFSLTRNIFREASAKIYTLKDFGSFWISNQHQLCFSQAPEFNANPEGFGLVLLKNPLHKEIAGNGASQGLRTGSSEKIKAADIWVALLCGLVTFLIGAWLVDYFTAGGVTALLYFK